MQLTTRLVILLLGTPLLCAAMTAEVHAICLPQAAKTAASRTTLVVTQSYETRDLRSLDPLKSMDITIPASLVFDTLLRRTGDGKLLPALAESWGNSTARR